MAEFNSIRRQPRANSRRRLRSIGAALLGLLPALATGCHRTAASAPVALRVEVTVAKPLVRNVTDYEDFIGRTKAADFVEVRSRVTGYLVKILFEDGDDVKRAQPLFEIDPRPFRAEYNKALADVKIADANLKLRKTDVDRNRPLVAKNTVTQADFDKMVAQLEEAEATLESRRATADTAKLNLSFTHILSPIDGRASRAKVTYGNLVQADSTLLTTVVSVDPIYVYFNADEETHLRVQAAAREGKLKLDKGKVDVWMELASESGFPHRGLIDFSENEVDPATATIEIRGVFANPKPARGNRILQPGLFCRVRVPLGEPYRAILIAERAIGSDQGQKYVLVVKPDHKVEYRSVELGRLEDGLRVISAGLKPDDQVIVSGTQRARPGAVVEESVVDMSTYGRPSAEPAVTNDSSPAPEAPKGPREVPNEIDPAVTDDETGNDQR